jgi:hypothetical protein
MEEHHDNPHEKKHGASESFMDKHRAWLNGSLKEALGLDLGAAVLGGTILAAAGITLPLWMFPAMAAPFIYAYMVGGGDKKKGGDHGHGHGHAH